MRWALLLVLLAPVPAHALLSACTLFTITGVSFGSYSPTSSTDLDGSGTFSFDCVAVLGGGSLTISLSTGSSGSYAPRQMSSGAYRMSYNLFLDAGRSTVWGDRSGTTAVYGPITLPIVLGHVGETKTVYGRIPARQTSLAAGNYTDSVTITINF